MEIDILLLLFCPSKVSVFMLMLVSCVEIPKGGGMMRLNLHFPLWSKLVFQVSLGFPWSRVGPFSQLVA